MNTLHSGNASRQRPDDRRQSAVKLPGFPRPSSNFRLPTAAARSRPSQCQTTRRQRPELSGHNVQSRPTTVTLKPSLREPMPRIGRSDAQDRSAIRCPGSEDPMPRIAPRSDAGDFSIPDRQLPTPERRRSPGGGERIRTADPLLAKQVLSQLSYAPGSADRNRRTANRRSVARRPMSVVRYSDREGMRRRRRTPEQTTADGRPRTDRRHRGCKRPKNQGIQANDNPSPALVLRPPVP